MSFWNSMICHSQCVIVYKLSVEQKWQLWRICIECGMFWLWQFFFFNVMHSQNKVFLQKTL